MEKNGNSNSVGNIHIEEGFIQHTVSTTETNFLIYSEAADANLYIRKRFQICKILPYTYIRKFFQIYKLASLPPNILGNLC